MEAAAKLDFDVKASLGRQVKPAPFKYVRPDTLAEALTVLAEYGDDVRVLAGGQSLGAMLNMRIVTPMVLLDINRVRQLDYIRGGRSITTGALVRQHDALEHASIQYELPLLAEALPHVGHYQTRNRGTLGGSVAHADPSGEIPLVLATLGGEVELTSKRRVRTVRAADFFRSALVTVRQPDELITSLLWPKRAETQRNAFVEFAVREGDFAIVAVACVLDLSTGSVRVGIGGCGETPQTVIRDSIRSKDAIDGLAEEIAGSLEYRSDLLASAAYRRHLVSVLSRRALASAWLQERAHA